MFGWLFHYKNIQPEQLSLNLLVPISIEALYNNLEVMGFDEKQKKLIDGKDCLGYKIAQYVDTWVCKILRFLKEERDCQSDGTLENFLNSIRAIVRYQYLGRTEDATYKDIPVIAIINKHRSICSKNATNQQPIVNLEMKWLDLDKVHQQIVEPLRHECEFRNVNRVFRSITAIAGSFMRFLSWGLSTYRPPRRQQELRELKSERSLTPSPTSPANWKSMICPEPSRWTIKKSS